MYIFVCHSHKLANGSVRLRQVSKQDYRSWHRHVRIFCQLKSQQSSPSQHLHTRQLLSASTLCCCFVSTCRPLSLLSTLIVSLGQSASKIFPSALLLFAEWWQPLYYWTLGVLQNPAHYCWTKDQHGTDVMLKTPPLNTFISDLEDSYSGKFIKTLYSLF